MTVTRQSGNGLFRYAAVTAVVLAAGIMSVPAQAQQAAERAHLPFDAVYVVNGGDGMSGSITVINADTDTVAGTIALPDAMWPQTEIEVGAMPAEVTRTPRGEAFYVANAESGTVSVVDAATKRVVNTIAVGDEPVGAWPAGNGYAYVDNEEARTVSAINRRTQTVTATFDLGFTPGMAQLGPDGHLWVTDADNGRVVLFSLDTVARHEITVGAGAHGVVFSGDGRTAYVTNQLADTVSVINVRSRTVKKILPTDAKPNGMAFRPAG